jgi:GNAT superfamily N-acetyltransferase
MADLLIRPIDGDEVELFLSRPDPALLGLLPTNAGYRRLAAERQYRPEWSWVALRDGRVVGRAGWWGGPDDKQPRSLDWFDFDDPADGAALLREAPYRTEYSLQLPPRWRDTAPVRAAVAGRIAAAQVAGLVVVVERLRFMWTPECGLPDRPDRLVFQPEPDDDAIVEVLGQILGGTLDVHSRRRVEELGLAAAAREELEALLWYPSPRDWWRLAYTRGGELVGVTVPARNQTRATVAFVGVVPGQRGHGYGFDLLVEATYQLVAAGAAEIVAATDTTNIPMAAAFARAGYPVTAEQIDLR